MEIGPESRHQPAVGRPHQGAFVGGQGVGAVRDIPPATATGNAWRGVRRRKALGLPFLPSGPLVGDQIGEIDCIGLFADKEESAPLIHAKAGIAAILADRVTEESRGTTVDTHRHHAHGRLSIGGVGCQQLLEVGVEEGTASQIAEDQLLLEIRISRIRDHEPAGNGRASLCGSLAGKGRYVVVINGSGKLETGPGWQVQYCSWVPFDRTAVARPAVVVAQVYDVNFFEVSGADVEYDQAVVVSRVPGEAEVLGIAQAPGKDLFRLVVVVNAGDRHPGMDCLKGQNMVRRPSEAG